MGSSDKRKKNDNYRIPTPRVGGDNGGDQSQPDINKLCPVSIKILLKVQTQPGLSLWLDGNKIMGGFPAIELGTVSTKRLKQFAACESRGIAYDGISIKYKGVSYAEFTHSS